MKLKEKECTEVINITKEDLHFHYDQYFSKTLSHGNLKGWGVQCSPGFPQFTIHPIPGIIFFHKSQIPENGISFSIKYTYEEPELEIEDKMETKHICLDDLFGESVQLTKTKGEKMFEDMVKKHVTVFRKDGNVLQGFITEMDEKFIKMTELDNNTIIFSKDCIDLIRLGIQNFQVEVQEQKPVEIKIPMARKVAQQPEHGYDFLDEENPSYDEKATSSYHDEFSMPVPKAGDGTVYRKPSFFRVTEKDE